jgi:tetratricopeptide (TPR) repeat protein
LIACRRVYGVDHAETIHIGSGLAMWLSRLDDDVAALELLQEFLAASQRTFGEENSNTLVISGNLATLHQKMGNIAEATRLTTETLEVQKRTVGLQDDDTISTMMNLGVFHKISKDYDAALPLLQQSMEFRRQLYGFEHPKTLCSAFNLGELHSKMGNHAAGIELLETTVRNASKSSVLHEGHEDLGIYRSALRTAMQDEQAALSIAQGSGSTATAGPPISTRCASDAEAKKEEGNAAFHNGHWQMAVNSYTEGIGIDPTNHFIYSNRSNCFGKLGLWPAALADAETCIKLKPGFAKGWIRLADSLLAVFDPSQAIASAECGLRCDKLNPSATKALRVCLRKAKQMVSNTQAMIATRAVDEAVSVEADESCRKSMRAKPNQLKHASPSNGSWVDVHKHASCALGSGHSSACHLHQMRGQAWFYTGFKIDRALVQYTKAVRAAFGGTCTLAPSEKQAGWSFVQILADAMKYRANVYMERRQFDEAETELKICLQIDPLLEDARGLLHDIPRFRLPPEHDNAYTNMDFQFIGAGDGAAHAIWQQQEEEEETNHRVVSMRPTAGGQPRPS